MARDHTRAVETTGRGRVGEVSKKLCKTFQQIFIVRQYDGYKCSFWACVMQEKEPTPVDRQNHVQQLHD